MTRQAALMVVAIAMMTAAPMAQEQERLFKAAMNTELVDGDLKAAIEQYRKVAAGGNRTLAAQALLRMADAYQKLGDPQASAVYARVVRDYVDQAPAVATARARLGAGAATSGTKSDRAVWTGETATSTGGSGRVSPDGGFITWNDSDNGRLMLHDIAAGTDRELTPAVPGYAAAANLSAITGDGKQAVYVWFQLPSGHVSFRTVSLAGSGVPSPRELYVAPDGVLPGWNSVASFDISPDGKWIAAAIRRQDRTGQIVLISMADGSSRVLKSMDWRLPLQMFFSPDGKTVAYIGPPANTDSAVEPYDVFVLAIDGSREVGAVVHPARDWVMGWSPDGTKLLFLSDRTGVSGLWALPFADGRVAGAPELLRADVGSDVASLGLTASGALYLHKASSTRDIAIAPIDLEAGRLIGPPVGFTQGFADRAERGPYWSPDGRSLVYNCEDGACIRSVATGQVRRLPRTLSYYRDTVWSPDGRWLATNGRDQKGREGVFIIDVQSGEARPVSVGEGTRPPRWSSDGAKVYLSRGGVSIEHSVASGLDREVGPELAGSHSPDGRFVAARRLDASTKSSALVLHPLLGGQPRELLRLSQPESFGVGGNIWTPDSRAVLVVKDTGARRELWLVPVVEGSPRKLDIDPDIWMEGSPRTLDRGFTLSPDGRRLAFYTGKKGRETWALENFLPKASATR